MDLSEEQVQQIVSDINLEQYDDEQLYTDANTKVFGGYYSETLPELPKHQEWNCDEGCGTCTPELRHESYMTVSNREGLILKMYTGSKYVSKCCKKGFSAWDNEQEDIIDVTIPYKQKKLPPLPKAESKLNIS